MTPLDPLTIGLATAVLTLAGIVIKLKVGKRQENENSPQHRRKFPLICEANKYDGRITTLEEHRVGVDARLGKHDTSLNTFVKTTGAIATDIAVVKQTLQWIKDDSKKRNGG
jgi:hypothetical protein